MPYMTFIVQIPASLIAYCKSGLLGIYFVKYGGNERHAAQVGMTERVHTLLRFIMEYWSSVHQGPNKTNKNKWLVAHSRIVEIDQEENSIHVNRQVSQVWPFMQFGCAVDQTGETGPDLRVCRNRTRTLHLEKLTGISDGH